MKFLISFTEIYSLNFSLGKMFSAILGSGQGTAKNVGAGAVWS